MLQALRSAEESFLGLCLATGREVLVTMMEQERTALCGPKWLGQPDRVAYRAGSAASEVTFGGRRVPMRRLRARSRDGRELELPSFTWATSRDPLDQHTLEAVAVGVATRGYRRSLEPLAAGESERSVSKSAVSRRFVALSTERMGEFVSRPLGELDIRIVMIDGLHFRDHVILIALGVDCQGHKHVLALREGSTENATVAKETLSDLIARGLRTDRVVLFVIDGSKALRKAISEVFGARALVQRCHVHKLRNVLDHLPEEVRPSVKRALGDTWALRDAELAEKKLEAIARSLEREHPGAAGSLREGLAETLTLQRLGITGPLYRTLRSTNAIENLNGLVGQFVRNVRRWRDGLMIVRWVAAGILEASRRFRSVRGCQDLNALFLALDRHDKHGNLDSRRKAA
jgi:transposase-like protein